MTALGIDATLKTLIECACVMLAEEERPACVCATTIGEPVVAISANGTCSCDTGEGELWGSLMRLYRGDRISGLEARPTKPCVQAQWVAQYQITLARCFPVLDSRGNLPTPEKRAAAAERMHADAAAIVRAITCCTLPESAYVENALVQDDPQGGSSRLVVTVRVPVSVGATANVIE